MKDKKNIKITGQRIFLKKLKTSDATSKYCSWLNDPEVNKFLATKKATVFSLKQYIKEKNKKKDCLFLGIFFKKNKEHIGNIKLEPIDFKNEKAVLGIMIGEKKYWGKGLGAESIKLATDDAFKKLKLKEINLIVNSKNTTALRTYQKAGFIILRRGKVFQDGSQAVEMVLRKSGG